MAGFLDLTARALYETYGDDISSLNIIFPSRRARVFFNDALSRLTDRPIWQPTYLTLDQVAETVSGLRQADPVRLITELYKTFSKYHNEPFDTFYFWGERLLADFDAVDQYMVDARMLFNNISDLKTIESDYSYLTPEQRETIVRFWGSFGQGTAQSEEQRNFTGVWGTLADIYGQFRDVLSAGGIGYGGMIYRQAAEKLKAGYYDEEDLPLKYAVVGFNALSACEKAIFDHLKTAHQTLFFWDYDDYYVSDSHQEAGSFMRENIVRYPQTLDFPDGRSHFSKKKNLRVIKAPGDSMQSRYVAEALSDIVKEHGRVARETAVVLADENLLNPVLNSIPQEVDKINVTMGFPLRQTLCYSFTERLIELQNRRRQGRGKTAFYHSDVTGLLRHPFVMRKYGEEATEFAGRIIQRQQIYIYADKLNGECGNLPDFLFADIGDGWESLSEYLEQSLSRLTAPSPGNGSDGEGTASAMQEIEFAVTIIGYIRKLRNSLRDCGVVITTAVFASLLRRILQGVRIPFVGEPLEGLQVMGILETRCLDFVNVIILSMNDDTYPGNLITVPSFIPYNLKMAYGLPTAANHEAIFAYYFYRLLQRAKKADIVYSTAVDETSGGEPSRFINQLLYESPHQIEEHTLNLNINIGAGKPMEVIKDGQIMERLLTFTQTEGPSLTPTSLSNYLQCPLKFYFQSVAGLRPEDEIAENVDDPMFGTLLHRAVEILYSPLKGKFDPRPEIKLLIGSGLVNNAVDRAVSEKYFRGENVPESDYGGNIVLIRDIIIKYLNTCILPFDSRSGEFAIAELEKRITGSAVFTDSEGRTAKVNFKGFADRVDMLADGSLRIVDYKTGADHREFNGLDALMSGEVKDQNPAALQAFIYAMLYSRLKDARVRPALYYVRQLNREDYDPSLIDKGKGRAVSHYSEYSGPFEDKLGTVLSGVFDPAVPFVQCADDKPCQWCDFNLICRRKPRS